MKERLGVSFKNSREMLTTVDKIPERFGPWVTKRLSFKDSPKEFYLIRHRNPIEAIQGLWGDPAFAEHLVYKPAKIFRNDRRGKKNRIYNEMWTGALWNGIQVDLKLDSYLAINSSSFQEIVPSGSTLAPVIIASDKTQLTQFTGGKSAYPVYLTIGNLPKSIRRRPGARACVLIAYLSVDKMAKEGRSKKTLQLRNYELFHRSMLEVLAPLKAAGNPEGEGIMLIGGNGEVRRVYPFLASYVADYPEQCLVTCTKYGTCPKCRVKATNLGASGESEDRTQTWTEAIIKEARSQSSRATQVHSRCMKSDVAGGTFRPFWVDFPLCDIHGTISPDVLHQLYQGVLKHLIYWIQLIMTEEEFDLRLRSLPPAFGVRHFAGGISSLKQVTGPERKQLGKVLLACLAASTSVPKKVVVACRSILDFIYLAQYPSHDEDTLSYMQEALDTWHSNKSIFVELKIRLDFNIPKFHSLTHYVSSTSSSLSSPKIGDLLAFLENFCITEFSGSDSDSRSTQNR